MKAYLLTCMALSSLIFLPALKASEVLYVEDGHGTYKWDASASESNLKESEKDAKIVYLGKMLDQQQKLYEEKINYLEYELKKSKERLVEKSINQDKIQDSMLTRFNEESNYLKKELVAKTKTLLEYQRQLEKIKPSEDMKNLIKVNTELALELRKSTDQLALIQIKRDDVLADKPKEATGRMPASIGK